MVVMQKRERRLVLTNLSDREKEDILDVPTAHKDIFGTGSLLRISRFLKQPKPPAYPSRTPQAGCENNLAQARLAGFALQFFIRDLQVSPLKDV